MYAMSSYVFGSGSLKTRKAPSYIGTLQSISALLCLVFFFIKKFKDDLWTVEWIFHTNLSLPSSLCTVASHCKEKSPVSLALVIYIQTSTTLPQIYKPLKFVFNNQRLDWKEILCKSNFFFSLYLLKMFTHTFYRHANNNLEKTLKLKTPLSTKAFRCSSKDCDKVYLIKHLSPKGFWILI